MPGAGAGLPPILAAVSRLPELYVAVDVEADGPIPGPYSMISLGMAVAGRADLTFYTELRPISDDFVPAALAVSGLDRERLRREAPAPEQAMAAAARWIGHLRTIGRPVFLAAPAVWDGMFVHWYFMRFTGKSPFGATGSGVDLRSYWMGLTGCEWAETRKGIIKHRLGLERVPHTHHAGEDAAELAEVFEAVLDHRSATT
ncbi:exonuclease [Nonomuraea zeae]|uniref:Exonuclease n=1 Tax=Nonomuraea zeae TaxID=1642303 RepID=A0A5S4GP58_9ACTN|nr:exonuclease [Nonomuraea zeae]